MIVLCARRLIQHIPTILFVKKSYIIRSISSYCNILEMDK